MVLTSSIADGDRFRNRADCDRSANRERIGATSAKMLDGLQPKTKVVHGLGVSAAQLRHKLAKPAADACRVQQTLEEATS